MEQAISLIASLGFLLVLAAAAWGIPKMHRHPHAGACGRAAAIVLALGVGIGLCFVRYMPRTDVAVWGVPIPLAIFKMEQGRWVDYVGSPVVMVISAVANVVFVSGIVHWAAYLLLRRSTTTRPAK